MAIEQEIVTWLEQHSVNLYLQDVPGRKAFLFAAGLNELQNTLALEGATLVFCRNFVQQLRQYGSLSDGRDPLVAVLKVAKKSRKPLKSRSRSIGWQNRATWRKPWTHWKIWPDN